MSNTIKWIPLTLDHIRLWCENGCPSVIGSKIYMSDNFKENQVPLTKSKSKKAFSKNVKAEMKAGKPQRQAVAIAYSVKKKAKK